MANPPTRHITVPKGFYAAGTTCGLKESGWPDLALIAADRPCSAAGVFSKSRTPGAPLLICKRHLRGGRARAVIVNSGNANASTGKQGQHDARQMCHLVAEGLAFSNVGELRERDLSDQDVLVGSTGIIGRPLAMDKITAGIEVLVSRLAHGEEADAAAARAILTTDLATKSARRRVTIDGKTINIGGIAKGSGMIAPNMGTMLAYITTDLAIGSPLLSRALRDAVAASFNRISVDQHTSPSDMVLVLASGAANNTPLDSAGEDYDKFLTVAHRPLPRPGVSGGQGWRRRNARVLRERHRGAQRAGGGSCRPGRGELAAG